MSGYEAQVQPRNPPQEPEPDEEPQIPPQQDELKNWNTDEDVPVPGRRETPMRTLQRRIPAIRAQSDLTAPEPVPDRPDQNH